MYTSFPRLSDELPTVLIIILKHGDIDALRHLLSLEVKDYTQSELLQSIKDEVDGRLKRYRKDNRLESDMAKKCLEVEKFLDSYVIEE